MILYKNDAQATAHYLLISQTLEQQKRALEQPAPSKLSLCMMSYGMECPFCQFKSAVLILNPYSS